MQHDRRWLRYFLLAGNAASPAAVLATGFEQPLVMLAAAAFHTSFASAVMRPQCSWFGPVATRFETAERAVWLTIDDGPAGEDSLRLGDELARRGVAATFFVVGRHLAAFPRAARHWMEAGHTVANHTFSHPAGMFPWLWQRQLRGEIDRCAETLAEAGVSERRWFRSPVGLKSVRLHPELSRRGLRLVSWNVRSGDGFTSDPETVTQRVLARARPGSILLLHERRPRSVETILRVVDDLRARGFTFTIPADGSLR